MDLIDVRETRVAHSRDDLVFGEGERPLGGGTWLFSEPQPGLNGLVDLTALDWQPLTETDAGLTVAATCPVATLREYSGLFRQAADSLLASWKIQRIATVGGNICLSLPAGSMTSLSVALDAVAVIWTATGERRVAMADFVLGVQRNVLEHGEVLRSIEFPRAALTAPTGFRRIALSPLGRTGTLVIGRVDRAGLVITISGGTTRPHQLGFDSWPTAADLTAAVDAIDDWYDDAHGSPDWRRAMSLRFALELAQELGS